MVPKDPEAVSSAHAGPRGLFDIPIRGPRVPTFAELKGKPGKPKSDQGPACLLTGPQLLKTLRKAEKGRERWRERFKEALDSNQQQ